MDREPNHSLSAYSLPPHPGPAQQRLPSTQRFPRQRVSQPVEIAGDAHQLERCWWKLAAQLACRLGEWTDRFGAHRCRAAQLLNQQLAIGETAHPPVGKVAPDQTQGRNQGLILGLVAGAGRRAPGIEFGSLRRARCAPTCLI